jgi:hypothetical protein
MSTGRRRRRPTFGKATRTSVFFRLVTHVHSCFIVLDKKEGCGGGRRGGRPGLGVGVGVGVGVELGLSRRVGERGIFSLLSSEINFFLLIFARSGGVPGSSESPRAHIARSARLHGGGRQQALYVKIRKKKSHPK